jgi:hypothetical protein
VFVSAYDDVISEVTRLASIRIRPAGASAKELILKTGRGFKVDKISDQWEVRPLKPREVTLSEEFLEKRCWRFEALVPFGTESKSWR